MVSVIYRQIHSIGIFISAKHYMMPICIYIPYLSTLQILKFIVAHTT